MERKLKYFTLAELCFSNTAKTRKIDNFPTFDVAFRLFELGEKILDPLREAWGRHVMATPWIKNKSCAIIVRSGYRCPALNASINGSSKTSVHQLGLAADLQPANGEIKEFIRFAKDWIVKNRIRFDQFIIETQNGGQSYWLHIGLYGNHGEQRGQFLDYTI